MRRKKPILSGQPEGCPFSVLQRICNLSGQNLRSESERAREGEMVPLQVFSKRQARIPAIWRESGPGFITLRIPWGGTFQFKAAPVSSVLPNLPVQDFPIDKSFDNFTSGPVQVQPAGGSLRNVFLRGNSRNGGFPVIVAGILSFFGMCRKAS